MAMAGTRSDGGRGGEAKISGLSVPSCDGQQSRRSFLAGAVGAACAAAVVGRVALARSDAGSIVMYSSADDTVAGPVVEAFTRATGIRVLTVADTEATKTTGLVQRLRAERGRPRASVWWSNEVFGTIALAREGLLEPFASDATSGRPDWARASDGRWHMMAMRVRVAVYHTRRVDGADVPGEMRDLCQPRWRGKIVVARPGFGTTRGHMATLVSLWGEERAREWMKLLRENEVRFVDGNSAVVRAIAQGEADIGLTDTDDVWSGQRQGWPVTMSYIGHGDGAGPLWIPNTLGLVAGGPDRAAAVQLIEFLLSEEVERLLAGHESRHVPLRASLRGGFEHCRDVPGSAVVGAAEYERVAESMDRAMRLCREEWGQ